MKHRLLCSLLLLALQLAPSQCADPGRACPIVAQGVVRRGDYGLDSWSMAMRDEVRFSLRVHFRDKPGAQ